MAQFYTDTDREEQETALPDAEAFKLAEGEMEGPDGEHLAPGWYWWPCLPGCLPDDGPSGPFDTEAEAIEDARGC